MFNHRRATASPQRRGDKTYYSKPQDFYQCSTWKMSYAKFSENCSSHHINTAAVREIILDLLRETSGYVRAHEAEFMELVREKSVVKKGETAKNHKKQITKNERRIAELEKIFRSLYEDKALSKIDEERFMQMSAVYEQERNELLVKTTALQDELDTFNTDSFRADKFVELVHKFTNFEELTPAMINEFIEKIIIHEGEWSDGRNPVTGRGMGARRQKIEIQLKYIGQFDVPDIRTQEEIEAENTKYEKIERERKYKREYGRRQAKKKKNDGKKPPAA